MPSVAYFRVFQRSSKRSAIFYCSWHSRKALQQNLPSFSKGCDLMLQAMYKTTFAGLEQFIQAIAKLPLEQNKNYVRCNFGEKHGECAMWSRQHSLVLAALNDLDESGGVLSCGLEEKGCASYPLHFGASYGHPEVVKLLVPSSGQTFK